MALIVGIAAALLALGLGVSAAFFMDRYIENRDSKSFLGMVLSCMGVLLTAVACCYILVTGEDGQTDPADTESASVSLSTSTPMNSPTATTDVPPETTYTVPEEVSETTSEITSSAEDTPAAEPTDGSYSSRYVTHNFMAYILGFIPELSYPVFLIEADEWTDYTPDVNGPEDYFIMEWEGLARTGSDIEIKFIQDRETVHIFTVEKDLINVHVNESTHPVMAVAIEGSEDLSAGTYGVTRYFLPELTEYEPSSDQCNLAEARSESDTVSCTWIYYDNVAHTEVRKPIYEQGLGYVLEYGATEINLTVTPIMYEQMMQ